MIKNIKINNLTHKVIMNKEDRFIGVKGENKFETLKFTFEDEFLNGEGILEIQKSNSQKEYIILDKEEDCYLLEVKNSLLTLEGEITMQLVVRLTDNKVFKSVEFTMQVLKAIEATTEIPDEYEIWDSTLAAKILEIDSKLEDMTDLEQDLEDKLESGYFKGEKGGTGEPGQDGADGQDGIDGKSAYQIWLDEGNEGTEQDFLNSLKGADGRNGVNGRDGINGTNGQDGYTPVKGTDYYTEAEKTELKDEVKQAVETDLDFDNTVQGLNDDIANLENKVDNDVIGNAEVTTIEVNNTYDITLNNNFDELIDYVEEMYSQGNFEQTTALISANEDEQLFIFSPLGHMILYVLNDREYYYYDTRFTTKYAELIEEMTGRNSFSTEKLQKQGWYMLDYDTEIETRIDYIPAVQNFNIIQIALTNISKLITNEYINDLSNEVELSNLHDVFTSVKRKFKTLVELTDEIGNIETLLQEV